MVHNATLYCQITIYVSLWIQREKKCKYFGLSERVNTSQFKVSKTCKIQMVNIQIIAK